MITKVQTKDILDSVPVGNNINILTWIVNQSMLGYQFNHKSLAADLRSELESAFGKQNITKVFGYRTKIWVLEFKDLTFNVFSAPTKGTNIEIVDMSYTDMHQGKRCEDIIEFLEQLSKLINKQ
jgi:hypothetical protein